MRSAVMSLFALVLVTGCQPDEAAERPVRPAKSIVVQPLSEQPISFSGLVAPQIETEYSFQILGRMISRKVNVGDLVAEGDLLASLDPTVLEQEVRAAEAALSSARATLSNAIDQDRRQRTLLTSSAGTQAKVDDAEQSLQAARSAVTQAQAALDKAREQLGYARLVAGFSGVVTAVTAEPGQIVSPGHAVLTLARPDLRDAVIDVPDQFTAALDLGMPLLVLLELDPSVTATGVVREIGPRADAVTRTRRVKIALKDPPDSFRLGTNVKVPMPMGEPEALTLPDSAVLRRDGKTFVWVLPKGSDALALRTVELRRDGSGQWAVQNGLTAGERILAAGVNSLAEGQRIQVEGQAK